MKKPTGELGCFTRGETVRVFNSSKVATGTQTYEVVGKHWERSADGQHLKCGWFYLYFFIYSKYDMFT